MEDGLDAGIEQQVEALGFELVELEQAGSKSRPILRLRIDRPDSTPGQGVSIDDCAHVSRAVEQFLEERAAVAERYVLEVSSPGIERPLVRPRDYERFTGREVAIRTNEPVADLGRRVEGVLRGIENDRVRLDIAGRMVEIPRAGIRRAHLVFRWDDAKK